jgi:ABC-type transport system substrate-binding protein
MESGYWTQTLNSRISRRRALAGGALLGAGVIAAACGGDEATPLTEEEVAGIVKKPVDTTRQARIGGTYEAAQTVQPNTLDGLVDAQSRNGSSNGMAYSRLLKFKPGYLSRAQGDVEGDLAERYEVANDGLSITLKLRQGVTFDPRPPTNNRVFDSRDVAFSWQKFSSLSTVRGQLAHAISSSAPIESVSTPDASTVVFKLAFRTAVAETLLAWSPVQMQPFEFDTDKGFDPRGDMRGTGPYRLKRWVQSSVLEFERNPDFYMKGLPFIQNYNRNIIPEPAARLSQFRAGKIFSGAITATDVIQTKLDLPQLDLYTVDHAQNHQKMYFGMKPGSPFVDQRVRQAFSLLFDRETFNNVVYDLDRFKAAGFPTETKLYSHGFTVAWGNWWVDPEDSSSKGMGEAAQFFKHDVAQAKQLLSAAGYANGFECDFAQPIGVTEDNKVGMSIGFLADGGIKATQKPYDNSYWQPTYALGKGNFDGVTAAVTISAVDPSLQLFAQYHPQGERTTTQAGQFPEIEAAIEATVRELDFNKRQTLVRDLQRKLAVLMPIVPWGGSATSYTLYWPFDMNQMVYNTWSSGISQTESLPFTWIDETKRTT